MSYQSQSTAAGRHIMPDLVRSFAILGIALVNVGLFAWPMELSYYAGGFFSAIDKWAAFGVNSLFMMKSYTLFSFMFGVGFAYQMQSAERSGSTFGGRYFRRITGLLVLGMLHIAFGFQGDILLLYGVLGALLLLFRNSPVKTLCWAAGVFISIQILFSGLMLLSIWAGNAFAPEEMSKAVDEMMANAKQSTDIFGNGNFMQAVHQRIHEYTSALPIFFYQGAGVMGYFLLGLAAVKSGYISDPDASIWRKFRKFALPVGVLGSGVGAWLSMSAEIMISMQMMAGMVLMTVFAPLSTAGYLGLIAKWASGPVTGIKIFMARGGTATLSAYLMQSLLLSLIFNNYGLGYFGKLGAAACIAIALGVALFTLVFSSLWRTRFKLGPMEILLRGWTYLGKR